MRKAKIIEFKFETNISLRIAHQPDVVRATAANKSSTQQK